MGGAGLAITEEDEHTEADWTISYPSGLPWWTQPVLYLPVLQLMAYHRSINKGLDPDRPRNLTAVVELDRDDLLGSE